jgi:hypothetical protein
MFRKISTMCERNESRAWTASGLVVCLVGLIACGGAPKPDAAHGATTPGVSAPGTPTPTLSTTPPKAPAASATTASTPPPQPKARVPEEADAIRAKLGSPNLLQRMQGYVIQESCLARVSEPATTRAMPDGAKFEMVAPNPPLDIAMHDPSVAAFNRFAFWMEGFATPAAGKLLFGRLYNAEKSSQIGWGGFCVDKEPAVRSSDWRSVKGSEPGKIRVGLTDEGLKRIMALGPTKKTLFLVVDEQDIALTISIDAIRTTKAPILTLTYKVPEK